MTELASRGATWAVLMVLATAAYAGAKEDELALHASEGDVMAVKRLLAAGVKLNSHDEVTAATVLDGVLDQLDAERRMGAYSEAQLRQLQDRQMVALGLMIDAGARLEEREKDGATALIFAAGNGGNDRQSPEQLAAVKLLLERGSQVNAADGVGNTALHRAAMRGYADSVRLLLAHGASRTLKNQYGETPAAIARPGPDHPAVPDANRKVVIALLEK